MTGSAMTRSAVGLALMLGLLVGCDENGDFSFPSLDDAVDAAPAVSGQTTELIERDVEAPEVFQVTEQGLWDGRPSLGGVWVAYPDVAEPERVIIRNQANGTFVIGALFRRERENPGPALQVSSDAAAALEMLAGAPALLNVTALRREEAAIPVAVEAEPTPDLAAIPVAVEAEPTPGLAAPDVIEATPLDPIATAAAAVDAAEAAAPAPAATPVSATASLSLDRPYIQIGIFSVEANAENTATAMRTAGLTARVVVTESQGSTFWRVLVGPAQTGAERTRLLDQVKSRGFTDAYFVRN